MRKFGHHLFGLLTVVLAGVFFFGTAILSAQETASPAASEAPSAETASDVSSGENSSAPAAGGNPAANPTGENPAAGSAEENAGSGTGSVQSLRENAEKEAFGENRVTDVHMKAVETLELPPQEVEEAKKVSAHYMEVFRETVERQAEKEFLVHENTFLRGALAERGAFSQFLKQFEALKNAELEEYTPIFMKILEDGNLPAGEKLKKIQKDLELQAAECEKSWKELHDTLVEREFLQFDLQSNRHIVTQLASMFSMDKRWFWLLGLVGFGALVAAAWLDRRHEIRRWLNGGRARQMKLTQVLTAFFCFIAAMTLLSFFMGETIYQAMLDMTFRSASPHAMYAALEGKLEKEQKALGETIRSEEKELAKNRKVWKDALSERLDDSEILTDSWCSERDDVRKIAVLSHLLRGINAQISEDEQKLREINGNMSTLSGDTLFYLRVKHLLRFLLGMFLCIGTFLGIACFWSDVHARLMKTRNTCPHCLSLKTLEPCDENGVRMPSGSRSKFVCCTKMIRENPYETCGYRFETALRPLTKLSFPTLGIPQVGKTHWLTMLYWEISNNYYPQLGFSSVPSSVTKEMDRRIEEIMTHRQGTAATQRDSIPLPLVLKYKDKDHFGQTSILTDIFDYSGEITTDAAGDDYRRERALKSEGFLFFLDPTYPWQPQAEALRRFRRDLKALKGLRENQSLRLPIAVCITKIDLLPLVKALGADAECESIRFYEELGRIDPTGVALNKAVIDARSVLTDELRKKIWPDWDMESQINDLFGGRFKFFPLTPVGLDGVGEPDLRLRTIAPFGLVEPLAWLLEMSGYPTLQSK